jgi:hypothetical protein
MSQKVPQGPEEQLQEQAGDGAATAPKDKRKTWKVEAVVGERGKTRATKELRIKWLGHKQTTWELLSTLGADCPDVMREWALRPTEAKQKLAEASDTEVVALLAAYVEGAATVLCDLSKAEWKGMIRHACKAAGIDIADLALVVASPPCETLSPCDASNVTRGTEHRDHKDPERPPRRLSTCKKLEDFEKRAKAIAHDKIVGNVVLSLLHDM